MRNVRKIIIFIAFFIIMLCMLNTVEATSIKSSANTVEKGKAVTITVSVPNVNTVDLTATVSGAGTSGTIRIVDGSMTGEAKTFSKSITVTPTTTGTIKVVVSSSSNAVLNGQYVDVSASKSITVTEPVTQTTPSGGNSGSSGGTTTTKPNTNTNTNKPSNNNTNKPSTNTSKPKETKSNNSRLKSLQITEGTITPEFNSGTREYQINVSNEITKLNVLAVAEDSKASIKITGNEEIVVGENIVQIIVTAEDGSTTTYKVTAVRAQAELNLQALSIFYINENGEKVPLILNPIFEAGIYEYTLSENISYKIDNLIVEGVATRETAEIQVTGNEGLKEGENTVQIKVIVKDETGLEEQKTYTVKLNKEAAPVETPLTFWDKVKNWFAGAGTWVEDNLNKVLSVALIVATTSLVGLTIYFAYDYKNYKKLLEKLAQINKSNLMEKANNALIAENVGIEEAENINDMKEETIEELEESQDTKEDETEEKGKIKAGRGKRFKE